MLRALPQLPPVDIRPITADDKDMLAKALAALSPESAYARFLSPKPRFNTSELRYLTEVDGINHVALVATLCEDPAVLVGVARFVREPLDPATAEAAIVVGDEWQGRGLGRRLGEALALEAAPRGIRRFHATMLSDNRGALAVFRHLSERLDSEISGGVRELYAELSAA